MFATTLSRCHPPRYCDFLEKLVVDDGIKTLGLHLCATSRERSVAHVYRQSHLYKIIC